MGVGLPRRRSTVFQKFIIGTEVLNMDVKWPFYLHHKTPRSWSRSSSVILSMVGVYSKIWAAWLNRFEIYNKDILLNAVERSHSTPLLTVSNHTSCIDDPLLWGILKLRHLAWDTHHLRWTLAAADITFTKELHSCFFSRGRCVPIVRGDGVYQKGVDFILEKFNAGDWVHIFPEGKVNMTKEFIRLKWGIGRLLAECKTNPIVIPLWHIGMDSILPNTRPYIPRIGKKVTVLLGEPIDVSGLVKQLKESAATPMEMRKSLTDYVQEELYKLQPEAEELHRQRCNLRSSR